MKINYYTIHKNKAPKKPRTKQRFSIRPLFAASMAISAARVRTIQSQPGGNSIDKAIKAFQEFANAAKAMIEIVEKQKLIRLKATGRYVR